MPDRRPDRKDHGWSGPALGYQTRSDHLPFCGTGCNFDLAVNDGKVIGSLSNPNSPVNGRNLCVKGRFGWDFNVQ